MKWHKRTKRKISWNVLDTLGANLLGNLLTGKGTIRASEGTVSRSEFLMLPHPSTNFEIQKYYQKDVQLSSKNRPNKCNGVYSRNNLLKIKDKVYLINFDEFKSIGTHWIPFYANNNNITYLTAFELNIFQK